MAAALKTYANIFRRAKKTESNILNPKFSPTFADLKLQFMARVCQVTGKTPIGGNKVSHSNIKTKRRFLPNLQTKKFFLAEENKWITLKLTTDAIRTINKNGLYNVVKGLRAQGQHI
jgi:large subunit ribosomal protein L28